MSSPSHPFPDPRQRFSDRVADYVRYRPGYPPQVVPEVLRCCGLPAGCTVADVGSGTGISTRALLDGGCTVFAIEPNRAMRAAAEAELSSRPGFRSVNASAEATTLDPDSVDLVVAAQAFHWFHPDRCRVEFRRILRSPAWVALIWNDRQTTGTPFLDGYEQILRTLGTDYAEVNHRNVVEQQNAIDRFFGARPRRTEFPNHQDFDLAGLLGRAFSSSYTPAPGDPRRGRMEAELRRLFSDTQSGGTVRMTYVTQVFVGELV